MSTRLFTPAFADPAGSPIRELFPYLGRPGMISFAGGYPSPALFDAQGLAHAAGQALADPAAVLQYGATEGSPALRQELLRLSRERGIPCKPQELLVTSGSQQAFDLLVRVLVQPGDAVLVETPAYPAALQALRLAGADIHAVPMDQQGLRTDVLEETLRAWPAGNRPKLLYTVPTFSNPRGSLLAPARRRHLLALAREHGFLIVEDDPYGELSFAGAAPPPLYALAADSAEQPVPVAYLSSLSKTVAPALRIGWMVAPEDIARRCAIAKQTVDLCTSPLMQQTAALYLQSGRYHGTVRAACEAYRQRVAAMAEALAGAFGPRLQFDQPQGGLFLWAEFTTPLDPERFFAAAVEQGVVFVPGKAFFPHKPAAVSMRLSFAGPAVDDIREGVARLRRAVDAATAAAADSG